MVTQLVEHERIKTTYAKAKALRGLAERVLAYGKNDSHNRLRRVFGVLTTPFARKKLVVELAPRFK